MCDRHWCGQEKVERGDGHLFTELGADPRDEAILVSAMRLHQPR